MSKRLLKTMAAVLAIAAAAAGPVRGQNASPDVTLDFTTNDWGLPTSGMNQDPESYSNGTYSITLSATTSYKFNSGYLLLGKSGSYLELPEFESAVDSIVVVGNSAASGSVNQNIYVGGTAVSTQTTGAKGPNTYVINENYRAAGNIYTLKVENAYNTQITYIKVYYVSSGGGSTPEPPTPGQNSNVSWVLTPHGDLQDGDTVVIVDKTSERAMTNNNGSYSAPSAVEIGLSGDQNALSDAPAATLQWVVERDNGNYMFKVPGTSNYLYCTSDNDGVRVGSGNKSFEFQNGGDNNVPFLKNNATSRYLGLTNAYLWRCPSSISSSSIKNNVISFYKKTVVIIPTHTVRMAEGTEEAANWTLASGNASVPGTQVLGNVMSGSQVTATYNGTQKVKSVKAVKYVPPAATVATAPTATGAIIEVGSTAALVNAGAASGGTMMYAVTTTSAQPASTADFSASVPTAEGRAAGTYYVWYYAKADAEHSDSEIAGPVSVTVTSATITVTINQSDWGDWDTPITKDGVTVSAGMIDPMDGNLMEGGTFSTTLGNFTQIVVTATHCNASGTGWSGNNSSKTWAGTPASTVSFSGNFMGMGQTQTTIVCTIQPTN